MNLIINPLGEVILNDNVIAGTVNVSMVAQRVLTPAEYKEWSKFKMGARHKALNLKVDKGCKQELDRQAKEQLTAVEFAITKTVWRLLKLNNDRFRFYGGVRDGRPWIILCTEFLALVEEKERWKEIRATAKRLGAKVYKMSEEPHLDHVIYESGTPNQRDVYGENHGKMERQVEFSWEVYGESLAQIRKRMKFYAKETEAIWKSAGVSVI